MSHTARFTLTIANGGTDSGLLSAQMNKGALRSLVGNCSDIQFYGPAALTGVVTVQIASTYASPSWKTLQKDGTDVTIAAGKVIQVPIGAFENLRLHSSAAEGAARTVDVVFQVTMGQ